MKHLRNELGITLAELLATLAIGSIIIILIMGVFLTFNKQYSEQSDEIRDLTNISTGLQAITKNIRSATEVEINETNDTIKITQSNRTITYTLENGNIVKDNVIFLRHIENFEAKEIEEGKFSLEIKASGKQKVKTTIALRKGGE